jgi:hypothetical protein
MLSRFKFLLPFIIFSCLCNPALAEGEGSAQGGNQQTPVQMIVTIILTAIVLKVLNAFKLP